MIADTFHIEPTAQRSAIAQAFEDYLTACRTCSATGDEKYFEAMMEAADRIIAFPVVTVADIAVKVRFLAMEFFLDGGENWDFFMHGKGALVLEDEYLVDRALFALFHDLERLSGVPQPPVSDPCLETIRERDVAEDRLNADIDGDNSDQLSTAYFEATDRVFKTRATTIEAIVWKVRESNETRREWGETIIDSIAADLEALGIPRGASEAAP